MIIVMIRSLILYILVICAVRLMGKRQLGELQPSELVITILVSNIATLPLEDVDIPLMVGITPIFSLVCFEVIVSNLSLKFPKLRKIISGRPKIIISDGKIDRQVLRELRYSVDDVMTSLRNNDIFNIEEVQYAIVETTGSISAMKKPQFDTPTKSDLNIREKASNPPQLVISDGILLEKGLAASGMSKKQLADFLNEKKLSIADIFIMTADSSGCCYLAEKNE